MMMTCVKDILYSKGLYNDVIELIFDYIVGDKYSHKNVYDIVMCHFGDGQIGAVLKPVFSISERKIKYSRNVSCNTPSLLLEVLTDRREPYSTGMYYQLSGMYNTIEGLSQSMKELGLGKTLSFNSLIERHYPHLRNRLTINIKKIISTIKTDKYLHGTYDNIFKVSKRVIQKLKRENILTQNNSKVLEDYIDTIEWGGDLDWNTSLSLYYGHRNDYGNIKQSVLRKWYRNNYHGDKATQEQFSKCMFKIKYDDGKRLMDTCKWIDTVQTEKVYGLTVLKNNKIVLSGNKRRVIQIKKYCGFEYIQFIEEKEGRHGKREYWTLLKHNTKPIRGQLCDLIGVNFMVGYEQQ